MVVYAVILLNRVWQFILTEKDRLEKFILYSTSTLSLYGLPMLYRFSLFD